MGGSRNIGTEEKTMDDEKGMKKFLFFFKGPKKKNQNLVMREGKGKRRDDES